MIGEYVLTTAKCVGGLWKFGEPTFYKLKACWRLVEG